MSVRMSYLTDQGKKRPHNEDAVKVYENEHCQLLVVADGMGGHQAGDVASQIVLKTLDENFDATTMFKNSEQLRHYCKRVLAKMNRSILNYIETHNITQGMGTTIVLCVVTETFIGIAHVGDSRAYVLAHGTLRQITRDHTFVRHLVEAGKLTESEARKHPHRHVIMNALGAKRVLTFDFTLLERYQLNSILLCTDGLYSLVDDNELTRIIMSENTTTFKVQQLIDRANELGGHDNISVVLLEKTEGSLRHDNWFSH